MSTVNPHVAPNVYLLCGDASLDTLANTFTTMAYATNIVGAPFYGVHTIFKKALEQLPGEMGKNVFGFVDTNPALTIYTHMALCACKKLIVPLNADEFSAVAINEIFLRVYATEPPPDEDNVFGSAVSDAFQHKVKSKFSKGPNMIELPKIHMVIMNKTPLHAGAAFYGEPAFNKAVSIMGGDGFFGQCFEHHPENFVKKWGPGLSGPSMPKNATWVHDQDAFLTNFLFFMSDLHSAATVMSAGGVPLNVLQTDKNLLKKLKAEVGAHGCNRRMLSNAKMFLDYLVKHMTEDRAPMPRNVYPSIKYYLVPPDYSMSERAGVGPRDVDESDGEGGPSGGENRARGRGRGRGGGQQRSRDEAEA